MNKKIRIGICGYGNLGKGVEKEIAKHPDLELAAIFTRRPAGDLSVESSVPVVHIDSAMDWQSGIDVMVMCGGSANSLPEQVPVFAKTFNTIDSFDTHAKIPAYLKAVDSAAKAGNHVSIISIGWDPGMFSLMRLYMSSILLTGSTHTFWGEGVSQGHSEAIRGIEGVTNAIQYTIPVESAMKSIRNGENPQLTPREKHTRLCYVVVAENADKAQIKRRIKEMPDYFDAYDTTVCFISSEELKANHDRLPHGGNVIHMGTTGGGNKQVMEFSLKLDSNPEFTASVLLAYARAAYRLSKQGERGAKTIFDIPPAFLLRVDMEEAITKFL